MNPAIDYRMYFTSGDTGGRENFDRINGIILESGDGRRFAAVWDEKQPDIGAMRIWDPDEGTREEEPAEEPAEEMAEEETAEEEAAEEKTLEGNGRKTGSGGDRRDPDIQGRISLSEDPEK